VSDATGLVLPSEFAGAWRRTDLHIGGRLRDDADVLWLQTSEWYADLRIPHDDRGGPIEAFAGPARWVEPYFTWLHHIDWVGSFPDDVGHLAWDDGVLIETGWFEAEPKDEPYEERWVPDTVKGPRLAATLATESSRAAVVRVGDEAITLVDERPGGGGFAARRDQRIDDRWTCRFSRAIERDELDQPDLERLPQIGDELVVGDVTLGVIEVTSAFD
jgi:hypothetical protein